MKKTLSFVMVLALVVGIFAAAFSFVASAETGAEDSITIDGLVWKNGQFYHTATPAAAPNGNYIYTVLELDGSKEIKFEIPGTWMCWVYPAVNGVATGEYRGGAGNKAIANGEVIDYADNVTELRITAYLANQNPVTVDSEAMSTFDLKFTPVYTDANGLVWKNGEFYHTATPAAGNGKYIYTVLELDGSKDIKFEIPGTWMCWVYPAVNGVATGEYRGGAGNKAIANGEVISYADNVTELRITAYLASQVPVTVDSEAMSTLDLKFTIVEGEGEEEGDGSVKDKYDRVWFPGSYYYNDTAADLSGIQGESRKYTELKTALGEVLTFKYDDTKWELWAYVVAEDGSALTKDIKLSNNYELVPAAVDGKNPAMIRVTVIPKPDGKISADAWATFDLKISIVEGEGEGEGDGSVAEDSITIDGLVWQNGTLYDGVLGSGNGKYICTVLKLDGSKSVKFDIPGTWLCWVYPAVNGVTTGEYRGGNSVKAIANGEVIDYADNITEIHITAYLADGTAATVDSEAMSTFDLKFTVANPGTSDFSASYAVLAAALALIAVSGILVARKRRNSAN